MEQDLDFLFLSVIPVWTMNGQYGCSTNSNIIICQHLSKGELT